MPEPDWQAKALTPARRQRTLDCVVSHLLTSDLPQAAMINSQG